MSHFIIGRIKNKSDSACDLVSQQLLCLAANEGLVVRLLDPTNFQFHFEVIDAAGLSDDDSAVFFDIFAESGTADELISPYVLIENWPLSTSGTLHAMTKLASSLLRDEAVLEVSIVFTEGYDISYEACETTTESAPDFLLKKFSEAGRVPSLLISMKS